MQPLQVLVLTIARMHKQQGKTDSSRAKLKENE